MIKISLKELDIRIISNLKINNAVVNRPIEDDGREGRSLIKIRNKRGPSTECSAWHLAARIAPIVQEVYCLNSKGWKLEKNGLSRTVS